MGKALTGCLDRHANRLMMQALALALLVAALCPAWAQEREAPRPLLVFAAASLQTALNAIAQDWQRETGRQVRLSFAASSALARQIAQGAPADLLATADLDWMDWAAQHRLIRPETRLNLVGNTLVLIEPAERQPTRLLLQPDAPLAQLIGDSRLATGNPQSVSVGRYAREALSALGLWQQLAARIAGADNVRAALALVARGEARFGIVYATDALSEPRVRVVAAFPATSHTPIIYPFAITIGSRHPDAQGFLAHLRSPAASRIFAAKGFTILPQER